MKFLMSSDSLSRVLSAGPRYAITPGGSLGFSSARADRPAQNPTAIANKSAVRMFVLRHVWIRAELAAARSYANWNRLYSKVKTNFRKRLAKRDPVPDAPALSDSRLHSHFCRPMNTTWN